MGEGGGEEGDGRREEKEGESQFLSFERPKQGCRG